MSKTSGNWSSKPSVLRLRRLFSETGFYTPPLLKGEMAMDNLTPLPVLGSTVSNTKLSESFGPHRVTWRELSKFRSVYYLCAKANSPSFFFPELTEFAPKLSEFSSPKQYSRSSIPPVSHKLQNPQEAPDTITSHDVLKPLRGALWHIT